MADVQPTTLGTGGTRPVGAQMVMPIAQASDPTPTTEWASFSIIQGGITVAGGSGPLDDVRREANHYAVIYQQDGAVKVRIRKLKPRSINHADT